MSSEVTRLPVVRTPDTVFKEMTKPLQVIVGKMQERMTKLNSAGVLTYYDLGTTVKNILTKTESGDLSFGEKPVEQMAIYFGHTASTLYGARQLAVTFTREFVAKKTDEASKKGMTLSYNHWLQLSRIPSEQRRAELLASCIKQRWSQAQLGDQAEATGDQKEHHRAGGRKPGVPKEPVPALIKLKKLIGLFNNYGEEANESICNGLLDIPPDALSPVVTDSIDDSIQTLEEGRSTIDSYLASLNDIRTKMSKASKSYKTDEPAPKQVAAKVKTKAKAGRR